MRLGLSFSARLLFGAGATLGGVKRAAHAKVDFDGWSLHEDARKALAPIHHSLVTEYFMRLNRKRELLESSAQDGVCAAMCMGTTNSHSRAGAQNSGVQAVDMTRWNTMYRHELDTAQTMSQLLLQLDDNVKLREQLRRGAKHEANGKENGAAELMEMIEDDILGLLGKLKDLNGDVDSIMHRRLDAEDVVATSTNTWECNVAGRAGGEEAGLFASELAEMYKTYARETLDLKVYDLTSSTLDGHGGGGGTAAAVSSSSSGSNNAAFSASQSAESNVRAMMNVSGIGFQLVGSDVYRYFHHEIGVHKVQRVPVTDAAGKMQTSTAVFTMMPVLDPVSVDVHEQDCKIDFVRGSGPGGQGMQSSSNCVVLTHKPSGITVKCHQSRSALGNKEIALQMVAQQILAQRSSEQNSSLHTAWQNQWSSGERSEKMRTYNYPQNRVTDHRLRKDYPLSTFMDRGKGLKGVHDELNEISDHDRLNSVLLKHIHDNFSGDL